MRKPQFARFAALALITASCGNATRSQAPSLPSADLKAAVGDDKAASAFYERNGWSAAWSVSSANELIATLRHADRHGIDPSGLLRGIEGKQGADREIALTRAALALADILADGALDPEKLFDIYTLPRPQVDLAAGLSDALATGEVDGWLDGLAPGDSEYRAMSEAYLRFRKHVSAGADAIPGGSLVHVGETDPRVPQIRGALADAGYLQASPEEGNVYTESMAEALKRMQRDYGIADDGVVGPDALEVLNAGPAQRARQLAVNLERRRWLVRKPDVTRIDVNTAAALLDYWRDGQHRDRRRVIVGQPSWETPQLQAPIFRLVANPTWTVPRSIQHEEIEPKGSGYMRRNNMVWRDGWIVQLPGPDNALGQVKFDMKDDYAIYLHDTPAKQLFQEAQRHFSHGCIRVQDALAFARTLAEADGKLERFETAMASGDETFVNLTHQIPVRLVYHTVFTGDDGRLAYRLDAYGWDEKVARALGLGEGRNQPVVVNVSDVGP